MNYPIANNFKRNPKMKPAVKIITSNGGIFNFFNFFDSCKRLLRKMPNAYNEMRDRIFEATSYDEAFAIIIEYVEIK